MGRLPACFADGHSPVQIPRAALVLPAFFLHRGCSILHRLAFDNGRIYDKSRNEVRPKAKSGNMFLIRAASETRQSLGGRSPLCPRIPSARRGPHSRPEPPSHKATEGSRLDADQIRLKSAILLLFQLAQLVEWSKLGADFTGIGSLSILSLTISEHFDRDAR
jgi:hypothetical protein